MCSSPNNELLLLCREAKNGDGMNEKYVVDLSAQELSILNRVVCKGESKARRVKRAQALLAANQGLTSRQIETATGYSKSSVERTKKRFVLDGLEDALRDAPRPGAQRKLCVKEEALLIATACSEPPVGCAKWTCELLAGEMVKLTEHEELSSETVRRRLAEKKIKPWQEKMWCIPTVDAEYVYRMENILDLYASRADPLRPVVCFDESPVQLLLEKHKSIQTAPGRVQRVDYEYKRGGTANLFVFLDAHKPWRHVKVGTQRTAADFALCMKDLVDQHYPNAEKIRVVLDNLSTHKLSSLYKVFPAPEARRIAKRLELHFTPKHASWLNMVEIEIGVLKTQCLIGRYKDKTNIKSRVAAWLERRNASGARIKWLFTVDKARQKMGKLYASVISKHAEEKAYQQAHRKKTYESPSFRLTRDKSEGSGA